MLVIKTQSCQPDQPAFFSPLQQRDPSLNLLPTIRWNPGATCLRKRLEAAHVPGLALQKQTLLQIRGARWFWGCTPVTEKGEQAGVLRRRSCPATPLPMGVFPVCEPTSPLCLATVTVTVLP